MYLTQCLRARAFPSAIKIYYIIIKLLVYPHFHNFRKQTRLRSITSWKLFMNNFVNKHISYWTVSASMLIVFENMYWVVSVSKTHSPPTVACTNICYAQCAWFTTVHILCVLNSTVPVLHNVYTMRVPLFALDNIHMFHVMNLECSIVNIIHRLLTSSGFWI